MIDKGKYAAHGVFIKKIDQNFLGKWSKPKNAVINPIPTTQPRQKAKHNEQNQKMKLVSKTLKSGFKFQQPINIKPVPQDLIQPFLYIQKVIGKHHVKNKGKTEQIKPEEGDKRKKIKKQHDQKLKPFITSKNVCKNQSLTVQRTNISTAPPGYANLYQYEADKKHTANIIFQKMLEAGIQNVKDMYNLWCKDPKRNTSQDINIKQGQFIQFVKQLIPNKVTEATIKHFFQLYKNSKSVNLTNVGILANTLSNALNNKQTSQQPIHNSGQISVRAFSYNYNKFKKAQTQIVNIMSQKAAKDRYTQLKKYVKDFLDYYPQLKIGTQSMKQYQETLRKHFKRLYESYKNPFQDQINELKAELEKPIIKYDSEKKQKIQKSIQKYEKENDKIYQKLTQDYNRFINSYQQAIVKNHDLLFTKRTVSHLLWPILQRQPLLTRDLIQERVSVRQQQKQQYLECLSEIVVEIDNDKKHLSQDCFTLGQIVDMVKMKFRKKQSKKDQMLEQFTIDSLKKLIKQIKRQFMLKFNLIADNPNSFPSDQQIPMQILHTCFEMQCTKVLFKNRIWSQLLDMLPVRSIESKLHQRTIDANTCMQYLLKYFKKLDQRSSIQRNKSKQISLLVQNAYNQNFGKYAEIIDRVVNNLDNFTAGLQDNQQNSKQLQTSKKKKVGFGDVVQAKLAVQRGQDNFLKVPNQQEHQIAKDIIKMIHLGAQGNDSIYNKMSVDKSGFGNKKQQSHQVSPQKAFQNLHMLKSMARSYFQPQAMNTNAFDIRFYQKLNEKQKNEKIVQEQIIQLGNSMLLAGAPPPNQIKGSQSDPLRISRFLLKTIDKDVKQQQKQLHNKEYDQDIYDGVSNNFFKDKIKLQNRPTRYDSEGKSKYSVLLPVGYYESYIVGQSVPEQEKWFLRPHHVETLTQNPLSKKDNVIQTQYESKLEKLGLKKRPDQFVIQQNVKRKQGLISELQQRIQTLKKEVTNARRQHQIPGFKVNPSLVNSYYTNITQGKQDKDLQLAAYQGVLYDLRRKQRELLNKYRKNQEKQKGQPKQKWWQKKDKQFNRDVRKDRQIAGDNSGVHRSYVQKLKNNQIY